MRRWLVPPKRQDDYETFAAGVLYYTLLILLGVALIFALFVTSVSQLIFIPAMIGVLASGLYLLRRGRLRLASVIFVGGFWLVITLASFSINGLRNSSISAYAIVIIFSAVLFYNRAVIVLTGMSILSAVILFIGEMAGILPLRTTPLYLPDRFFQQIALFAAAGILLSAAARVIRRSLLRNREHEAALRERNRELELEIAERQKAEASLRNSEERYRLLFENIPIMATVYAEDGKIALLNNAAARAFEDTPENLQGRNLREIIPEENAEEAIRDQRRVMEEGKDIISEGSLVLPDGRKVYYLRHVMRMPATNGQSPSQVLALTTDVTEKYLADRRERELALTREKNAFLTEFFSTMSHDLKTPLTTMNTSLYLLKRAQTTAQREERMLNISEQVTLMDRYLQDMLAISRLEYLPGLDLQALNLNSLTEEVVDSLRPRLESKQHAFQFSGQPDLQAVQGDEEQLRRLLTNLIENAINYTPDGGHVDVKTYMHDGRVALEVKDSGIGIEPEAMPRIFERFFRAANAKATERSGTGLGLAIVKKIVETHAATIEVSSQPGEGTTFNIHFATELSS